MRYVPVRTNRPMSEVVLKMESNLIVPMPCASDSSCGNDTNAKILPESTNTKYQSSHRKRKSICSMVSRRRGLMERQAATMFAVVSICQEVCVLPCVDIKCIRKHTACVFVK